MPTTSVPKQWDNANTKWIFNAPDEQKCCTANKIILMWALGKKV